MALRAEDGWRAEWPKPAKPAPLSATAEDGVQLPPVKCRERAGDADTHVINFVRKGLVAEGRTVRSRSSHCSVFTHSPDGSLSEPCCASHQVTHKFCHSRSGHRVVYHALATLAPPPPPTPSFSPKIPHFVLNSKSSVPVSIACCLLTIPALSSLGVGYPIVQIAHPSPPADLSHTGRAADLWSAQPLERCAPLCCAGRLGGCKRQRWRRC